MESREKINKIRKKDLSTKVYLWASVDNIWELTPLCEKHGSGDKPMLFLPEHRADETLDFDCPSLFVDISDCGECTSDMHELFASEVLTRKQAKQREHTSVSSFANRISCWSEAFCS